MDAELPQPLAPLYYRDNFLRLCDTVQSQYNDILNHHERQYLQTFRALSVAGQCLYIRLVSRTGPVFRSAKLSYPEIKNLRGALHELESAELVLPYVDFDLDDLARLYTRPEIERMFSAQLPGTRLSSKSQLMATIASLELGAETLRECREKIEAATLVAPQGLEIIALLQLLFFGNRHQSLTEFVLEDLGVAQFYPYTLHPDHRLFNCRAAVDEYLTCGTLSDARYEILEGDDMQPLVALAQALLALEIKFDSTTPRWNKLCNRLGRDLERLEEYDLALALYATSQSHPSRERSARILEKQKEWDAAIALCEEIMDNPLTEAERDAAAIILPRVSRKRYGTRASRQRDCFEEQHLNIAAGDECVELLAADHLAAHWSSVHYVENSLMNALFGLAFWPIIFADEPGVFHHPFQRAPTDMYTDSFRLRRQSAIAAHLRRLEAADLPSLLADAYTQYYPYQNQWVDWRYIDESLVQTAATMIPTQHLLHIWQRILFDPRENRGGFPDLIAFGAKPGEYTMIEVKGPGDALQNNQKRWLRFFGQNEIPAQVAWIHWQGD